VLKEFPRLDSRKLSALPEDASDVSRTIDLEAVPHFTTFQNATRRIAGATRFHKTKYGRRGQVDTPNSTIGHPPDSALRARTCWSQHREMILRVLAHNVVILRWIPFYGAILALFKRAVVTESKPSVMARQRKQGKTKERWLTGTGRDVSSEVGGINIPFIY
jgi:hypothetical protein